MTLGHMVFTTGAAPFVCWGMKSSASWTAASMAPLTPPCLRLFISPRNGHVVHSNYNEQRN